MNIARDAGGARRALCSLLVVWSLAPWLGAQTTPAPAGRTEAVVQQTLSSLSSAAEVDPVQQTELLEIWRKVLTQVRSRDAQLRLAEEFSALRDAAPAKLVAVRTELGLSTPVSEVVLAELSREQLDLELQAAEAALAEARLSKADLDAERSQRATRRTDIPKLAVAARSALDALVSQSETASPAPVALAKRALTEESRLALDAQIVALDRERESYDARVELLAAREDLASRRLGAAEARVQLTRNVVAAREREARELSEKQAQASQRRARDANPIVRALVDSNATLLFEINDRAARRDLDRDKLARLQRDLDEFEARRDRVMGRVDRVGFTSAIVALLRRERESLVDVDRTRRELAEDQRRLLSAEVAFLVLEDERAELANLERYVDERLAESTEVLDEAELEALRLAVHQQAEIRRSRVDEAIQGAGAAFDLLVDLDSSRRQLVDAVQAYTTFIDERILWVRSAEAISVATLRDAAVGMRWLTKGRTWAPVAEAVREGWELRPVLLMFQAALVGVLLAMRRWMKRRVRVVGLRVRDTRISPFSDTVRTLGHTLGLACFWPLVLLFAGRSLATSAAELPNALAAALPVLGALLMPLTLLHAVCLPLGLGEMHLRWSEAATKSFRRGSTLVLLLGGLPLGLALVLDALGSESSTSALGRLSLVTALLVVTVFLWASLRGNSAVLRMLQSPVPRGWRVRLAPLWFPLAAGLPAVLAGASLLGYPYTAMQLGQRLFAAWALLFALILIHALAMRWLAMEKRIARLDLARRRREAAEAEGTTSLPEDTDTHLDFNAVDSQAKSLLRAGVAFALVLGLWGIWADTLPAFRALDRVVLWSTTVEQAIAESGESGPAEVAQTIVPVSLADLLLGIGVLLLSVSAARNIPGFLDIAVFRRLAMHPSTCYALSTFARYILSIVGIALAFGAIGLGWQRVQWLIAAMSLGLGFGLQEIFGNFVCGIILLFERRIRVDDIVTVGDISGKVMRIRVLATTIRDWDRKEFVVPNKELITGRLLNWTLSDQVNRIVVVVGVAYGTDTKRAREVLLEVANAHELTLDDPPPVASFDAFGDSSLTLRLRCFLHDMEFRIQAISELHCAIDEAFKREGLEIAFPQRDLHIRSMPQGLAGSSTGVPGDAGDGGAAPQSGG